jgi:phosphatidylinositol-3-phosphatase
VFFRDIAGDPPSKDDPDCAAHHRELAALAADLASGDAASYSFISPDLCHDMHGASGCPDSNRTRAGDDWLAANLPALIDFVDAHGGVIFVTWEEADRSTTLPFLALGPDVKPGYAGGVPYTHGSTLKTIEELLGLPILPAAAAASDLMDLFAR